MSAEPAYTLPPGYAFHDAPPPLDAYLALRAESGLSPKTPAQGAGALANSWAWCTVVYTPPALDAPDAPAPAPAPEVAGMVRALGDGGWYFLIADMAVLPAHQRRGLGEALLRRLLARILERAPPGPYITLGADGPGRKLYRKLGFVETAPHSIGMVYRPSG